MKTLILILTLVLSGKLIAQNQFEKFDMLSLKAFRAMEQKNYRGALNHYHEAFKEKGIAEQPEYLNAIICAARVGAVDKVQEITCEAVIQAGVSLEPLTTHEDLIDIKVFQQFIHDKYDSLYKLYYQSIPNLTVYLKVEELMARDQFVRKLDDYYFGITDGMKSEAIPLYMEAQKKNDTLAIKKYKAIIFPKLEEELKQYNQKMMQTIDSLNISELINITREHGWQKNAWFLLWHQRGSYGEDTPTWKFFKKAIDQEIAKGQLPKSFWAPFEDLRSIRTTGVSIYGYHPGKVDPEKVNQNRELIGLPALSDDEIKARNDNPRAGRMF
ncbi:hypothetical protein JMN32_16680 [Fulvivirga sp. 29W222]|uniref:Uncharacterized protein n=1 Tax=Fulvivirga marina TaxID=2494733 RepID=A0A937FXJ1_9BACT|nr:hypothetical protein [Fulvivirga marina]MBL6447954.1 hypothetical protein [Fulvivirga marina]